MKHESKEFPPPPAPTQEQVNRFLDDLRDTGVTNMYGASPYIEEIFSVSRYDARRYLVKWMETFTERHSTQ